MSVCILWYDTVISKSSPTTPLFTSFSSRRKQFMFYVWYYQIIFLSFRERYHFRSVFAVV